MLLLDVAGVRTAVRFRIAWTALAGVAERHTLLLLDVARPLLPGERGGVSLEAISSLLSVAVKMCYASSILFVRNYGILDAQILDRWWYLRLETASRPVSVGKEVFWTVQYATMVDLLLEAERAGEAQTAFVKEHLADAFDLWLREQYLRGLTEEEEDALRKAFEKGFGICVHDAS